MKRWGWFGIFVAIGVAVALVWWWSMGAAIWSMGAVAAQGANLLANPSFEGEYSERGAGEVKVAQSWYPWYAEGLTEIPGIEGGGSSSVPTGRPEYKPLTTAQCWFSFSRTNYAGIFQQVPATRGTTYQASAWAQGWCSNSDSNTRECPGDRLYISIGIDPDGGTWYKSRAIVWTQWQAVGGAYQQFYSLPVVANKERVTMFVASGAKWPLKHMDTYVDDAALIAVPSSACPTPAPLPTYTPYPTPQPCPTCEPGGERNCLTLEQANEKWGWLAR